jgi:hypothetical protein
LKELLIVEWSPAFLLSEGKGEKNKVVNSETCVEFEDLMFGFKITTLILLCENELAH